MHIFFFFNFFGRILVFFVGRFIPLFWTLRNVCPEFQYHGRFLLHASLAVQWIPRIHFWYETHWPLVASMAAVSFWSTYLYMYTSIACLHILTISPFPYPIHVLQSCTINSIIGAAVPASHGMVSPYFPLFPWPNLKTNSKTSSMIAPATWKLWLNMNCNSMWNYHHFISSNQFPPL